MWRIKHRCSVKNGLWKYFSCEINPICSLNFIRKLEIHDAIHEKFTFSKKCLKTTDRKAPRSSAASQPFLKHFGAPPQVQAAGPEKGGRVTRCFHMTLEGHSLFSEKLNPQELHIYMTYKYQNHFTNDHTKYSSKNINIIENTSIKKQLVGKSL